MPVYKDEKTKKFYFSVRYKDTFGQNKRKVKRGFERKKDAKLAEAEFVQKVKYGYSDSQTFDTIFYDRLKSANLSRSSIEKRTMEYNLYIKERFGNMPISKITTEQCRELRNNILHDYDLSLSTARSVWSGFKAVMNYALKYYKLMYNPTLPVEPIPRAKARVDYITRETFDTQVEKMENETFKNLTKLLFYSGLRVGEALALKWSDYDEDKGELNINKTLNLQHREIKNTVKTDSSAGIVPLPNHIRQMLNEMYEDKRKHIKYFNDELFIFGNYETINYATYVFNFKKVFPDIRIHTLRHSYASYLINNGVDMYVLMELMRHSNITETIQTYSHLYTNKKHDAMNIFN